MKLATWNLWWRFGHWERRQAGIIDALRALEADVVGLQEVWHTNDANFAQQLADLLGYQMAFAPSPRPEKWQRRIGDDTTGIGNAVLSRWPITTANQVRLPAGDAPDEGRMALVTTIDTPWGELPFTTTHLNSAWGQSAIREAQLQTTLEHMATMPTHRFPPVLCGDFNAAPDFDEIRAVSGRRPPLAPCGPLLDAWEFLHPLEPGWTWDRTNPHVDALHEPNARIDYLFVGPPDQDGIGRPQAAGLFGHQPADGVWPSDHFGVWVELNHQAPA